MDRSDQGMTTIQSRGALPLLLSLYLLVVGCATSPESRPPAHWSSYLPSGAAFYAALESKSHAALLAEIAGSNETLKDLVRRTQQVWVSWDFGPGKESSLSLLGLGDYPSLWMGIYLDWQSTFVKKPGPPAQWLYQDQLYVYQPENGAVLASTRMFTPQTASRGTSPVPGVVLENSLKYPFVFHIPQPGRVLAGPAFGNLVPLKDLNGYFKPEGNEWTGTAEAVLERPEAARFALLGLRMILGGLSKTAEDPREAEMYAGMTVRQEQDKVYVENIRIPFTILTKRIKDLLEEPS